MSSEAKKSSYTKTMAKLPLSLVESNILPRLPSKTIGRCMCISKQWKSILSTPSFVRSHLRHVTNYDYKLLLLNDEQSTTFLSLDCNQVSTTIRSNPNPNSSFEFVLAQPNLAQPNKTKVELPLSLIESDILPRLPAKTIGRCMCVCKQWKSFLSTRTFSKSHLRHVTINDYKLLLVNGQPSATFNTLDCNHRSTTITSSHDPDQFIVTSLDGLVCIALREQTKYKLAFWNPLTGAYKKLSSSPRFEFSENFDKDVIGFYIDSSDDYKLLCLINNGLYGAHIYSNKLDIWREIEYSFNFKGLCDWSPSTLWGQCLYFTVTYVNLVNNKFESHSFIICFNTKTETFREIRFPIVPREVKSCCGSLAVFNGSLHMCVSYDYITFDIFNYKCLKQQDLWRMDGDDVWVKVADFNDSHSPYNELRWQIIFTASVGNWLAVLEGNKSFNKLKMEDFMKRYWYVCSSSWWVSRCTRMIYVETLVSPNL